MLTRLHLSKEGIESSIEEKMGTPITIITFMESIVTGHLAIIIDCSSQMNPTRNPTQN